MCLVEVDEHVKFSSIQDRPLPQPPQVDLRGHNLHCWNLLYDQSKTLGQVIIMISTWIKFAFD